MNDAQLLQSAITRAGYSARAFARVLDVNEPSLATAIDPKSTRHRAKR